MLYKSLDYQKILAIDIFLFSNEKNKQKFRRFNSAVKRLLFKQQFTQPKTDVVFFQSMRRADYDEMFNIIASCCPVPSDKVVLGDEGVKFDIKFIYYLFVAFSIIRVNLKELSEYLFTVVSFASYIKYALCIPKDTKLLIVQADMQPIDNLLVQLVNLRGGKTATLQHGLYVDYSDYDNVNKYNYLNCVSANFFAWGDETAELISQYTKSKVHVCGKPVGLLSRHADEQDFFTIIFDQNIFHKQNVELLKLAHKLCEALGLKMNLRLHPRNNLAWYRYDAELVYLDKNIAQSRFVIGHTSTLIYECMHAGIPAFRYKTNVPANNCDDRIVFSNEMEFFEKYGDIGLINFQELGENYIQCTDEKSCDEYTKAIEMLLQKD